MYERADPGLRAIALLKAVTAKVLGIDLHGRLEILGGEPPPVRAVKTFLGEHHVEIATIVERIDVARILRQNVAPPQKLLHLHGITALQHLLRRRPSGLPAGNIGRLDPYDPETRHQ